MAHLPLAPLTLTEARARGGGFSGGPAKHCAIAIHEIAVSPTTFSVVSAIFRTCVTTWQNSTALPAMKLLSLD
jgi:hypothetical protein